MKLPTPNQKEVEEFKKLYLEHEGIALDDTEALDLATRFLIFCYLGMTRPPEVSDERWQAIYERTERNRNNA